jgi:hypothetical protein
MKQNKENANAFDKTVKLITIPKSSFSPDRELREASSFLREDSDASSFLFCIIDNRNFMVKKSCG